MMQAFRRFLLRGRARSMGHRLQQIGWSVAVAGLCACANSLDTDPKPAVLASTNVAPDLPWPGVAPPPGAESLPPSTMLPETRSGLTPSESLSSAPEAGPSTDATSEIIERGRASWYGSRFHGRRTASGEPFDKNALTAAHKTLPFGTRVRVRSLRNGREVVVRINDRGPFTRGRVIDLSQAAMKALGLGTHGVVRVELLRE